MTEIGGLVEFVLEIIVYVLYTSTVFLNSRMYSVKLETGAM